MSKNGGEGAECSGERRSGLKLAGTALLAFFLINCVQVAVSWSLHAFGSRSQHRAAMVVLAASAVMCGTYTFTRIREWRKGKFKISMEWAGWVAVAMFIWFALGPLLDVGSSKQKTVTAPSSVTVTAPAASGESVPPTAPSSTVESLSANWLLAKQLDRHNETIRVLTDAKERGDTKAFERILRLRSAELKQVIEEVNTGSYSISDKQKLLGPLQEEKEWADASLATLSN